MKNRSNNSLRDSPQKSVRSSFLPSLPRPLSFLPPISTSHLFSFSAFENATGQYNDSCSEASRGAYVAEENINGSLSSLSLDDCLFSAHQKQRTPSPKKLKKSGHHGARIMSMHMSSKEEGTDSSRLTCSLMFRFGEGPSFSFLFKSSGKPFQRLRSAQKRYW